MSEHFGRCNADLDGEGHGILKQHVNYLDLYNKEFESSLFIINMLYHLHDGLNVIYRRTCQGKQRCAFKSSRAQLPCAPT